MDNLLINPSGQFCQRGTSFANVADATYTLDRWIAERSVTNGITVSQNASPCANKIHWNADGWGGLLQILETEALITSRGLQRYVSLDGWADTNQDVIVDVLQWTGTGNKPTLDPVTTWLNTLVPSTNWAVVSSTSFVFTSTRTRFTSSAFTVPSSANLAVFVRANADTGSDVFFADTKLGKDNVFTERPWQQESDLCDWFYQFYSTNTLYNTEYGVGRVSAAADQKIWFQLPLRTPMRGREGGSGASDIAITWPVLDDGFWHYGSGKFTEFPTGAGPTMRCHHRHFILFSIPITNPVPAGEIPDFSATIWKHYPSVSQPTPTIIIDAELRP